MNVSIQLKQFKRINNHKHYNMNLKNKELELKKENYLDICNNKIYELNRLKNMFEEIRLCGEVYQDKEWKHYKEYHYLIEKYDF